MFMRATILFHCFVVWFCTNFSGMLSSEKIFADMNRQDAIEQSIFQSLVRKKHCVGLKKAEFH